MEQTILGQMLLDLGFVTEPDLERCLQLQRTSPERRPIGEILVEQGLVDSQVLEAVLAAQASTAPNESKDLRQFLANATGLEYLDVVRRLGATALHLSTGRKPAVRKDGQLVELPADPLTFERSKEVVMSLLTPEQQDAYHVERSIDALISVRTGGRFRASVFRHYNGVAGVFRLLADSPAPLDGLGLPVVVRDFAKLESGLLLVTGPSGSGRSTTVAALIESINCSRPCHIVTLEDVVEAVFDSKQAFVTQRQINLDAATCAEEVRSAQREDADVIAVGDLRGPAAISGVMAAAEAGHLVLATLHTTSVHDTLVRIIDQFPPGRREPMRAMLARTLRGVICQELLPNSNGEGRELASEVMFCNQAITNLIREGREDQVPTAMQMHRSKGMQSMADCVQSLVEAGRVSADDARHWRNATPERTPDRTPPK